MINNKYLTDEQRAALVKLMFMRFEQKIEQVEYFMRLADFWGWCGDDEYVKECLYHAEKYDSDPDYQLKLESTRSKE